MKPKQQKVELTLGLNSNCANYDQSKGKYSGYFGGSRLVGFLPTGMHFVDRHM